MLDKGIDDKVLKFICKHKRANDGLSPTMRQIKDEFSISSVSVVSSILDRLQAAGRIKRVKGVSGIQVVGGRWIRVVRESG